jgi:hypothetical protein
MPDQTGKVGSGSPDKRPLPVGVTSAGDRLCAGDRIGGILSSRLNDSTRSATFSSRRFGSVVSSMPMSPEQGLRAARPVCVVWSACRQSCFATQR